MKKLFFLLAAVVVMAACTPMKPALSVVDTTAFPVKGRQGLLIRQKLSFGDYQTSVVKRSWTRSGNTRVDLISGQPQHPAYPNLIAMDYADSDKSFYFTISDFFGNVADVYAVSRFHSEDLEDIFGGMNASENLFYLQFFLNQELTPWQLVLENDAAQRSAEDYSGLFFLDENEYYTLLPITHLSTKKGPQKILAGSIGFEIFNSKEESVAAVSLVDNGEVYFPTKDPSERLLLSSLCAALLLQEDIADAGI